MGLEGYYNGASPSDSLLYSDVDVQAVEVSASKNDIGGYFSLAYRSAVAKLWARLGFNLKSIYIIVVFLIPTSIQRFRVS